MNYIIIVFGTATLIAGIIIVIHPETVFGLMGKKSDSLGLHVLAVVVRIIIGVALIVTAAESKYPTTLLILGWISIVAASVFAIMGRTNFKRLMAWALSLAPSLGRIGGLLAILLGGFLVHAAI